MVLRFIDKLESDTELPFTVVTIVQYFLTLRITARSRLRPIYTLGLIGTNVDMARVQGGGQTSYLYCFLILSASMPSIKRDDTNVACASGPRSLVGAGQCLDAASYLRYIPWRMRSSRSSCARVGAVSLCASLRPTS
jgi:hypothetical protein